MWAQTNASFTGDQSSFYFRNEHLKQILEYLPYLRSPVFFFFFLILKRDRAVSGDREGAVVP